MNAKTREALVTAHNALQLAHVECLKEAAEIGDAAERTRFLSETLNLAHYADQLDRILRPEAREAEDLRREAEAKAKYDRMSMQNVMPAMPMLGAPLGGWKR